MKYIFLILICGGLLWAACGTNKIHNDDIESVPAYCNQPPYDKIPDAEEFIPLQLLPEMIYEEKPIYPRLAEQAGIEGVVFIIVLVLKDGRVDSAMVEKTSGTASLDNAAVQAAYKNRFKPGLRDGCPVASWVTYKVDFALD